MIDKLLVTVPSSHMMSHYEEESVLGNYDVKVLQKFQIASTTKPLEEDKRVKSQDRGYK